MDFLHKVACGLEIALLFIAVVLMAVFIHRTPIPPKKAGFDPYGLGLRYQTMLDASNQGPGTNKHLQWDGM
jgi:hypothetical protein